MAMTESDLDEDLDLLEPVDNVVAEDIEGLTAVEALRLSTSVEHGGLGMSAQQIADQFGLSINDVAPMVPIPARPLPILYGEHAPWPSDLAQRNQKAPRLVSEPPSVVNALEATCEVPKGMAALKAKALAAGWDCLILFGRGRVAKQVKRDDAELVRAYNDTVKKSQQQPVMERRLIDTGSVSLRMSRNGHRAVAVWANGEYQTGGHDGILGIKVTALTKIVTEEA